MRRTCSGSGGSGEAAGRRARQALVTMLSELSYGIANKAVPLCEATWVGLCGVEARCVAAAMKALKRVTGLVLLGLTPKRGGRTLCHGQATWQEALTRRCSHHPQKKSLRVVAAH